MTGAGLCTLSEGCCPVELGAVVPKSCPVLASGVGSFALDASCCCDEADTRDGVLCCCCGADASDFLLTAGEEAAACQKTPSSGDGCAEGCLGCILGTYP